MTVTWGIGPSLLTPLAFLLSKIPRFIFMKEKEGERNTVKPEDVLLSGR